MDESLVLKQDQAEAFHILSNTCRNHNPTSAVLQISTIFNCYGLRGGCFGGLVAISTKTGFSQWFKGLSQSKTKPEVFQIVFNTYRKHNPSNRCIAVFYYLQ
jgi:hypothetical protein